MLRSGLPYSFGLGFWGPNGHDGVWHLALANQVLNGFPPPYPTLSGNLLTNYHYFFDLIVALVHKISFIPIVNLYFQIFPLLLSFLIGLFSFLVGYKITKKYWVGLWFTFFNYFAGSFGFIVSLWRGQGLGGESMFWSMQSVSTQINPPFALSLVMILIGMYFLITTEVFTAKKIVLISLIFGLLIDAKAYAGIIILPGLGVYALLRLRKKETAPLKIFIISLLISVITFFAVNQNSVSLLVFSPFWFIHTMIEASDRLYIPNLALVRYSLVAGGGFKRLFLVEAIGLALFLVGNLGTRLFGLLSLGEKFIKKKITEIDVFFTVSSLVAFIIPLLFIQGGTSWNTIQFFYYFLFFANFYVAIFLARILELKRKLLKYLIVGFIVLLTIPTTISTLENYVGYPPPAKLSYEELEALQHLSRQPNKYVLAFPYSRYSKDLVGLKTPFPLYLYDTTSYVSAFSGKITFLEEETNLEISGYRWQPRRKDSEEFFQSKDPIKSRGFLLNNKIGYIYLVGNQKFLLNEVDLGIKEIFNNSIVRIYQVLQ